jgi:DNA mismatch repair ATPase MutL
MRHFAQNKVEVCSFLTSTVHSFLLRHGFVSDGPDSLREMDDDSPRPTKRRKPEPEDDPLIDEDVDLGSINLGGKAPALPLYIRTVCILNPQLKSTTQTSYRLRARTRMANSFPGRTQSPFRPISLTLGLDTPLSERPMPILLRRVGYVGLCQTHGGSGQMIAHPKNVPQQKCRIGCRRRYRWNSGQCSSELKLTSKVQANKAYALLEPNIPAIELAEQPPPDRESRCHHRHQERQDLSRYFQIGTADVQSTTLGHVFTKASLSSAEVINQVDRKFIACLMGDGDDQTIAGRTLVLVDQHAADERIRVERFLKELCIGSLSSRSGTTDAVHTKELSPPVPVLLTAYEASRLASSPEARKSFEHWGIRFSDLLKMPSCNADDQVSVRDEDYVQVMVSSVPEVVSEKVWAIFR